MGETNGSRNVDSSSSGGGGGILRRLRRINKREKHASVYHTEVPAANLELLTSAVPTSSKRHPAARRVLGYDEADADSGNTHTHVAAHPTTTAALRKKPPSPVREVAFGAQTPQVNLMRHESIHSIEPSLVDDESDTQEDSLTGSPLSFAVDTGDVESELDSSQIEGSLLPSLSSQALKNGDEVTQQDTDWHLQTVPGSLDMPHGDEELDSRMGSDNGEADEVPHHSSGESTAPESDDLSPPASSHAAETADEGSDLPPPRAAPAYASSHVEIASPLSVPSLEEHASQDAEELSIDADEEDGAPTPRAVAEPSRTSYFDVAYTPSVSTSAAPDRPVKRATLAPQETWLDQMLLQAHERYGLVREMVSRALVWELERLFLIPSAADFGKPSSADVLPRTDAGYLKLRPGRCTPDLPIVRFVYHHAMLTCPFFGIAHRVDGALADRVRAAGATRFFDDGVLPLARFIHKYSISRGVDLNGEWPSEAFNLPSTLGKFGASIFNTITRFITAFSDANSAPSPWASTPTPSPAQFLSHRLSLNQLHQGGFEVNVVGARLRSVHRESECEFLLTVRRFGFPPSYVIRTESDFYTFSRKLAEVLGPRARIRPVPPRGDTAVHDSIAEEIEEGNVTSGLSPSSTFHGTLPQHKLPLRDALSGYHRSAAGSTSSLQALASPVLPSSPGFAMRLDGTTTSPVRPTNTPFDSQGSLSHLKTANLSTLSFNSVKSASARPRSIDVTELAKGSRGPNGGKDRPSLRSFSMRSSKSQDSASPGLKLAPDDEARRKQVRAWLRDALSVRGAGHADETNDFLRQDAFGEKDLKAGSRRDVKSRLELDEVLMRERHNSATEAPREIIDLHAELGQLMRECIDGDGVVRIFGKVRETETFSGLPLSYQRLISWTNLQVAQFLFNVFLNSHEAHRNFERFQEFILAVPWKTLSASLREPTGLMLQRIFASFKDTFVSKKMLAVLLEDVPPKRLEQELQYLKSRLGNTVLRKLEAYTKNAVWQKEVIRKAAQQAEVPLVAAIVRGSDKPLLAADGIKRIVNATKTYKEFMASRPTYAEVKAKLRANVDVRMIADMQRALQLLCLRRDGGHIRSALEGELKPVIDALLDPLLQVLKRLHKTKVLQHLGEDGTDLIMGTQHFCLKLLDVLAGLRVRVQDPWRSLSTLTLLLDDAVPAWYHRLHHCAEADTLLLDTAQWLQSIARLLRFRDAASHDDLLARVWPKPQTRSSGTPHKADEGSNLHAGARSPPVEFAKGSPEASSLQALVDIMRAERVREMEAACRWAAGDADADLGIQLVGEGGKTRMTVLELPILPCQPPPNTTAALDRYLPGFRSALNIILGAGPGTAC